MNVWSISAITIIVLSFILYVYTIYKTHKKIKTGAAKCIKEYQKLYDDIKEYRENVRLILQKNKEQKKKLKDFPLKDLSDVPLKVLNDKKYLHDILIKVKAIHDQQMSLRLSLDRPNANSLHSLQKNKALRGISLLEKDKYWLLKGLLNKGLNPKIFVKTMDSDKSDYISLDKVLQDLEDFYTKNKEFNFILEADKNISDKTIDKNNSNEESKKNNVIKMKVKGE